MFSLVSTIAVSAQSVASIRSINGKVASINKGVKKYKKVKKDVMGLSTEGGEATFYHDRSVLKKITAKIYGETFNTVGNLYFEKGQPLYYEMRENRYDTQISLNKPVKVVKVTSEKYYFSDGKLVRIYVGNKIIKKSSLRYTELKDAMMETAEALKAAYS